MRLSSDGGKEDGRFRKLMCSRKFGLGLLGGLNKWVIANQCYSPGQVSSSDGRTSRQTEYESVPSRQAGRRRGRAGRGVKGRVVTRCCRRGRGGSTGTTAQEQGLHQKVAVARAGSCKVKRSRDVSVTAGTDGPTRLKQWRAAGASRRKGDTSSSASVVVGEQQRLDAEVERRDGPGFL
ncbi:hypothetical protein LZ32DRAFT_407813 [Colletotrichum eremochloae]|nr:hypothetical protein LZ32DRAFT_407813 [Colletotrichum eremochloae]